MNSYERPVAERLQAEAAGILLPPRERWVPAERRGSRLMPLLATIGVLALAILVVAPVIDQVRMRNPVADRPLPSPAANATFAPGNIPATPTPTMSVAPVGFPVCPAGESPLLDVVQPPPPGNEPGTGSGTPEAAFVKANPTITEYKMYQFGTTSPYVETSPAPRQFSGPVWIVAGSRTFIALYIGSPGQNSWFAHPATFVRCMTQEDLHPNGPAGSPLPARPDGTRG